MTAKPSPIPVIVEGIDPQILPLRRWITWRYELRKGKWTKPPYTPGEGTLADCTDPTTWRTFDEALADYEDQICDGIGFVLGDGWAGVDFDHCIEGATTAPWAQRGIDKLRSYTERSPGGDGAHTLVKGTLPEGRRRKDNVEMYDRDRYFTVTGVRLNDLPIETRQEALAELHREIFGTNGSKPAEKTPPSASGTVLDDDTILSKLRAAKNSAKFANLWAGKWDDYPSQSEGDLALCGLLAFYTQDAAQIDRLFRRGGLYRDKWDREDYSSSTIGRALESTQEHYTPGIPNDLREPPAPDPNDLDARNQKTANQTETAPGWQIFTLADAYIHRPPIVYAVNGLFSLPSLNIVYGASGRFKSLLLADMCACVAAGLPWLEPLPNKEDCTPLATAQCPTLWLDFDNGKRRTHERFDAIGTARGLSSDIPLHYVSMPDPWLDIGALESLPFLIELVKRLGAGIVVIDNLGTVSGEADENSTQMVQVMSRFRRLAEETGSAVVLIHHQRKTTGISSRVGETLRGSTSIEAALDLALLVEREEHSETVQMKSTKVRGPDVLPFGAMFTYEHREGTQELATARFWGMPIEDLVSDAAIDRAVCEILDGETMNKGKLAGEVKESLPDVGINRIRGRIDWLAAKGDLVLSSGDKGAKLYSLPSELRF